MRHDGRGSAQTLRRGVVTMFVGRAFPPVAALATAPLLAVGLGVSGRGELAAATAPLLLAVTIAPLGIPTAVTYVVARSPRLIGVALRRGAVLTLLAGLVAVVVAVQAATLLSAGDETLAGYMVVGALAIVPTVLVAVVQAGAAGLGRWRLIATERVVAASVKVIAIVVLFATGTLTVAAAVIVVAFAPVVGGLVYLGLRPGEATARADADAADEASARTADLLRYGLRSWIGAVAGILLIRIDQLLFVPVGGAYELGLYAVAVTICEAPLIVNAAVRDVVFTHDAAKGDDELLARASRMSTIATGAVALAIAATAWLWLPVLFGDDFRGALAPLLVLLAAVVLGNPGSIAGTGLSARGRPGLRSISLVIACVVNVAVFLVLVPVWGAVGAAVATLIGNLVSSNLNLVLLRRTSGIPVASFYAFRFADLRAVSALLPRAGGRA